MEIYTIGFTKKSAEQFFEILRKAGIKRVIDIRLKNNSQIAGFTKAADLKFFLKRILNADYIHLLDLAPTEEILKGYQGEKIDWGEYERRFRDLMRERKIEQMVDKKLFRGKSALLCSEPTAEKCHRRLVAEHLQKQWKNIKVIHL